MVKSVKFSSISIRLMLVTFTLLTVVVLSLSFQTYQNTRRIIVENQYALMQAFSKDKVSSLNYYQDGINAVVLAVASNDKVWTEPRIDVENILQSYSLYNSNVKYLYILRNDEVIGYPSWTANMFSQNQIDFLKSLSNNKFGVQWSNPYKSPVSNWSITAIARSVGAAVSPALSGMFLAYPALLGAPFLVAGGLKIVYDLLLYRSFKRADVK